MKTTLPERSSIIKERLDNTVKEILKIAESKIAMIILFGSYARGDWVKDLYQERYVTYSYQSDIDLLLVLKKGKYANHKAINLQYKIEKKLGEKFQIDIMKEPICTLILEPISRVNMELSKGQYFFSDIVKEGILLYDSREFELSEIKRLPWIERQPIAKDDFEHWFKRGRGFLEGAIYYLEKDENALGAFSLHQATESFYNTILLVFSGYKPKLHDLLELSKMSRIYHQDLYKIFPYVSLEQTTCFDLLRRAYIEARYNKNYNISKEQLLYLVDRVKKLKDTAKKICLEKLNSE